MQISIRADVSDASPLGFWAFVRQGEPKIHVTSTDLCKFQHQALRSLVEMPITRTDRVVPDGELRLDVTAHAAN
jgi:hypothetical protein